MKALILEGLVSALCASAAQDRVRSPSNFTQAELATINRHWDKRLSPFYDLLGPELEQKFSTATYLMRRNISPGATMCWVAANRLSDDRGVAKLRDPRDHFADPRPRRSLSSR
ncbi:hypothetical protein BJY59DRAFT_711575 [Rhodotorula toruloides]